MFKTMLTKAPSVRKLMLACMVAISMPLSAVSITRADEPEPCDPENCEDCCVVPPADGRPGCCWGCTSDPANPIRIRGFWKMRYKCSEIQTCGTPCDTSGSTLIRIIGDSPTLPPGATVYNGFDTLLGDFDSGNCNSTSSCPCIGPSVCSIPDFTAPVGTPLAPTCELVGGRYLQVQIQVQGDCGTSTTTAWVQMPASLLGGWPIFSKSESCAASDATQTGGYSDFIRRTYAGSCKAIYQHVQSEYQQWKNHPPCLALAKSVSEATMFLQVITPLTACCNGCCSNCVDPNAPEDPDLFPFAFPAVPRFSDGNEPGGGGGDGGGGDGCGSGGSGGGSGGNNGKPGHGGAGGGGNGGSGNTSGSGGGGRMCSMVYPNTSCYPVLLGTGEKVEATTDLVVALTGADFRIDRSYTSSVDFGGANLVGENWTLSPFKFVVPDGADILLFSSAKHGFVRFEPTTTAGEWKASGPTTQRLRESTVTIGSITHDTWELIEPGSWSTHFKRDGNRNPTPPTVPDPTYLPICHTDPYGNMSVWQYRQIYAESPVPSQANVLRLDRIFLHGTDSSNCAAELEFDWWGPEAGESWGALRAITVLRQNAGGEQEVTDRVEYAYHLGDPSTHMDVGTPGDLVQVSVYKASNDGHPGDQRVTQYRYHRDQSVGASSDERYNGRGRAHQLKSILKPEQIQYFTEMYNGAMSASRSDVQTAMTLLTMSDASHLVGTSGPRVIDLATKIVAYDATTNRVSTEYLQSGCGCGGSAQGLKVSYGYGLTSTSQPSVRQREFLWTGSAYASTPYRIVYFDMQRDWVWTGGGGGTAQSDRVVTQAAVDPATNQKWVMHYEYDSATRNLTRQSTPAACLSYVPCAPFDDDAVPPSPQDPMFTPRATTGLVFAYEYTADNRLTGIRAGNGWTPSAGFHLLTKYTYSATSGLEHLIVKTEQFASETNQNSTSDANLIETTTFDFGFHGTAADSKVAWVKTSRESELVAENGPSGVSVYESVDLFDTQGRLTWRKAPDGAVTKLDYDTATGNLVQIIQNSDLAALNPSSYASVSTSGWGRNSDGGVLTTSYVLDLLGRTIATTSPGGVTHYTLRVVGCPMERPHGMYYAVYNLPHQLSPGGPFDGPATITYYNAAGKVIANYEQELYQTYQSGSSTAVYDPLNGVYDFRTGTDRQLLARRAVVHSLSGLATKSISYPHNARPDNNNLGPTTVPAYETLFVHDSLGRVTEVTDPVGNITKYTAYDAMDRVLEVERGTTAGTALVSRYFYDSAGTTTQGSGNGNVTVVHAFDVNSTTPRVTKREFDYRDRLVRIESPLPPHDLFAYDNLNRIVERGVYSALPSIPAVGASLPSADRGMYSKSAYSQRGLKYREQVATVPSASSPTFLESHAWFDANGRTIAEWMPNSPARKRSYDGLGRSKVVYITDRGGDAAPGPSDSHADASAVTGDTVLEQTEFQYDTVNNIDRVELVTTRQRNHDSSATGTLTASDSVATYVGYAYDAALRQRYVVNFGTNASSGIFENGTAPSTGTTPPWPPTVGAIDWGTTDPYADSLISGTTYNVRGLVDSMIEHRPDDFDKGRTTKIIYDDLSRRIAVIENYDNATIGWKASDGRWEVTAGLSTLEPDTDRVTSFAYDGIGNVVKQVAHVPDAVLAEKAQVTQYEYNAEVSTGSLIESKALLSAVQYPDRSTGDPGTTGYTVTYQYNRLGELTATTDQNGTTHTYERDVAGRVIEDNAALASGNPHAIDTAVMGIHVSYDAFGRLDSVRSIDDPSSGTPLVMNEVRFTYTPLWQVEDVHQDVDSELNSTIDGIIPTRVVHYDYDTVAVGSGNYSRLSHMNYPSGASLDFLYGSTTANDRISRLDELHVDGTIKLTEYQHVGLSMFAVVNYEAPDVQLDRTLDTTGARRWSSYTTQAVGTYPGWDRFGRVIKQFWVDGGLTTGPNSLPDRPQIVAETHTYDRASNRLSKDDIRDGLVWYSQDNDYAYDMLDRLNLATRGRRGGGGTITPAGGVIDSSQQWSLDMLGNWGKFVKDKNGDGDFLDGAATPPANDLEDTRTHNQANEITISSTRAPFAYDDSGNLKEARLESSSDSRQYIHDVWNRLVEVKNDNGTTGTTSDDFTIARYGYNGLHWRVLKRSDIDPTLPTLPAPDRTDRLEAMFFDASWRLIEREILDGYAPASPPSSWTAGRAEELFWGARYIDDAVARRQSSSFDGSTESISAAWNDPEWYLTDAQFSVVARVDIGALVLERVRYDPYGNAQHIDAGDFNGNGQVSVQDIFDWLAVFLAATPPPKPLMADFNRDGAVSTQDNFDYQFYFFGPGPDAPEGWVSSADIANGGSDNVIGYCGYVFNHETSDYTVRFRHYSPSLGRWLERDPLGYVDGMSQYEYAVSAAINYMDPSGLECKADIDRLGRIGQAYNNLGCNKTGVPSQIDGRTIRGGIGNSMSLVVGHLDGITLRQLQDALSSIDDAQHRGNRGGKRLGEIAARQAAMRNGAACKALKSAGTKLAGEALGALGAIWDIEMTLRALDIGDDLGAISSGSSAAGGIVVLGTAAAKSLGLVGGRAVAIVLGPGAIVLVGGSIAAAALDIYWSREIEKGYDPKRNGECAFLEKQATATADRIREQDCCKCNTDSSD